jgi:hypothetical protein
MRGRELRSRFPRKKERGEVVLPNQRKGETYKKKCPTIESIRAAAVEQ